MKCPKCGYEDLIFTPPANVRCPKCGFEYKYKGHKLSKLITCGEDKMIAEWLIDKNKLALYVTQGIVVYADEKGEVHQGRVRCFTNNHPVWGRPYP